MRTELLISILAMGLVSGTAIADFEINTTLMHYTYPIIGPTGEPNEVTVGTVFLMAIPEPNQPEKLRQAVLITATHILEKISGEKATVHMREKKNDGKYKVVHYDIQIRKGKEPIWVRHETADIALIKINLPRFIQKQSAEIPLPSTNLLADDDIMEKYEIHPGDELLCLGYPLGATAQSGFPILRSGKIASYPLTPAKDVNSLLFDFEIFGGNSGGPVYFVDKERRYSGTAHMGKTIQFVAGIVSKQHEKLRLGVVVPAHFIKETLDQLDNNK